MQWIDIGINLTNRRFDKDRDQVIQDAVQAGVEKMIITGTNLAETKKAAALASENPKILYATAGCHPHDASSFDAETHQAINDLASHQQVVAIGECGLDFNRNFSSQDDQIKAFKQQLEIAVKIGKPVFLHERDAFDTQYEILKDYMPQLINGIIHCFTGTQSSLERYLDLGLSLGITGWICDERRGQNLLEIVKYIPDNQLMIETDGPYLTPRNLKVKPKDGRNEPKYLPHIAETVALARQQSVEHIAQITYNNSCQFFNLTNTSK